MVPLLDIDLQKPQEQDLQKIEDKETLKVLKSPRQKKNLYEEKMSLKMKNHLVKN